MRDGFCLVLVCLVLSCLSVVSLISAFFLKKTQKANVSEREGKLGRATRNKGKKM